ncbi:hypothetical protein KP509_10G043600 [Ceratopteris richardii]|nr:hypothetical protein KP509_10G043600 [Ceratopteris richardii]
MFPGVSSNRVSENIRPDSGNSKQLSFSKTNSLIQQLNNRTFPETNSYASEEIIKRLEILDEGLSKVITMLDCVQNELHKLFKTIGNSTMDCEGIKQKIILQESSLQLLLKEDEKFRTTMTSSLNKILKEKNEAGSLENLSDGVHALPDILAKLLSRMKTDLSTCIRSELKAARECLVPRTEVCIVPKALADVTKNAKQKASLSARQKKTPVKAAAKRNQPPVKRSKHATKLENDHGKSVISRATRCLADKSASVLVPVKRKRTVKEVSSKEGAARTIQRTVSRFDFPLTNGDENTSSRVNRDPKMRLGPKASGLPHSSKGSVLNMKSEIDEFSFEMKEEGECSSIAGDYSSRSRGTARDIDMEGFLDEDEIREIRKRMAKARRKRENSTSVPFCD